MASHRGALHHRAHGKPLFDHDRLDVYQLALQAVRELERVIALLPRGCIDLVDQLRRASLSVLLNLAEGAGEFSPAEKNRFYRMARRSAAECASVLDYCVARGLIAENEVEPSRVLYARVVGGIVSLMRAVDARPRPSNPREKRHTQTRHERPQK